MEFDGPRRRLRHGLDIDNFPEKLLLPGLRAFVFVAFVRVQYFSTEEKVVRFAADLAAATQQ